MLLKIYDKSGELKAEVSPDDSSTQVKEVQGDNVLTLSFTLYEHIQLDVNDYVDFLWERYRLMEKYRPKQKSTVEWEYNVKLYGVESLISRFLVLNTTDGEPEPVFTLTAPPREHVAMIVKCINEGMGTEDWKVGTVEGTELIVIDYEGKYCDEALKEVAEKVGGKAEWWVEGTTINISRCERGEEVTLAYGKGLTEIDNDTADNAGFYTRLFPVGSSRNIDREKYGYSRLQLPGKAKYVEVNTDKYGIHDRYEADAFSDIYPRRTGTVSSVRSEEKKGEDGKPFTIYYFTDNGLDFDPNDYEIGGLVKRVSFQEGSDLAGLGAEEEGNYYFEVNFDSKTREFEIITTWPYDDDTQLPGGSLVPKTGDKYILWNIRMPDEYYPPAEAEFREAVDKYNAEHWQDISVYKAPTDHVYIEENEIDLYVGRRVRLESEKYFPETGYRNSRITKITRRVNLPSRMDIEISDALPTGSLTRISDDITDVKNYAKGLAGSLPDIVRTGDGTRLTDNNLLSALRVLAEIAKRALSRLHDDEAAGLIKFLAGLEVGDYKEGLSGAKIDKAGNAEFGELLTRLKATLAQLQVNGDSEFRGRLSSEDFVSGFIGGKGWAIFKREVLNALGVPETKYTGEFDDLIVRGSLRIFELVISQLLGENDNRVFTGMMEVDHYDAETGRVYLDTRGGKYYNPFRADDYIMVQQYNGMPSEENDHYITKHYELIVTAAGCGDPGDGEERLDWVEFKNFVSADGHPAAEAIAKGDTFTRVDNATDADRKGLIQIITVGAATPYMDIVYGLKTDPEDSLKGRLGNLKGIHHHLFGWLDGFGELLTNLYAVGDFRLRRTGESLDAKVEMLKGLFATRYSSLRHELTGDENYLHNATFEETLEGWTAVDDGKVITSNGDALLMNGNLYIAYTDEGRIAGIEQLDGRNVLHLKKSGIRQANVLIRKPGTHKEYVPPTHNDMTEQWTEVPDTLYTSIRFLARTDGTLTVGPTGEDPAPGALPSPAAVAVPASLEWQELQWQGTWDGEGDFVLEYTGEMYVSLLSLTDRALEEFKKEVNTQIIQTAGNIRLLGSNIDGVRGTVTELGIELDAAGEQIRLWGEKTDELAGTMTALGLRMDVAEGTLETYAAKTDNLDGSLTAMGSRMDIVEGKFSDYVLTETFNGTVDSLGGSIEDMNLTLEKHWSAIERTDRELLLSINKATGYPVNKDTRFTQGVNGLSVYNTADGDAVELRRLAIYRQPAVPTADNLPAVGWKSDEERAAHVGDVYQNTRTGQWYTYTGVPNEDAGTTEYKWQACILTFGAVPAEQVAVVRVRKVEGDSTPGLGGFAMKIQSRSNAVFESRFTARIPKGYSLNYMTYACGDGSRGAWIGSTGGTGDWKEYRHQLFCGETGTFGTVGYFYLTKDLTEKEKKEGKVNDDRATAVDWYLREATVYDLSGYEDPISYINLTEGLAKIKAARIELEGLVTANENFKILLDGSIEAKNGKFTGEINASKGTIGGFEITSTSLAHPLGMRLSSQYLEFKNDNRSIYLGAFPSIYNMSNLMATFNYGNQAMSKNIRMLDTIGVYIASKKKEYGDIVGGYALYAARGDVCIEDGTLIEYPHEWKYVENGEIPNEYATVVVTGHTGKDNPCQLSEDGAMNGQLVTIVNTNTSHRVNITNTYKEQAYIYDGSYGTFRFVKGYGWFREKYDN